MLWLAYSFKRKNKGFELSAKRIKKRKGGEILKRGKKGFAFGKRLKAKTKVFKTRIIL